MKIYELLSEAPLIDYEPLGDFEKKGSFRYEPDKKLVQHPVSIQKTYKFFEKTPFNFRIFPVNIPGITKHRESGQASPEKIRTIFGKYADQIISGHENTITIVYIGNFGAERVPLTPWVMAHRFGHSIQAGRAENGAWKKTEDHFFKSINTILSEYYGRNVKSMYSSNINWELSSTYSALFNAIGTQRSSRTGQIKRPYEFLYELFTQYLQSGQVKLNPLPISLSYGKKAFGRSMQSMRLQPEYADEYTQAEATDRLANQLNQLFDSVLSDSVGKIYLM
jgi:hypothetical protein